MNNYKLSCIVIKHLKSFGFKPSEIRSMKCNKKYLKEFIYNNKVSECCNYFYCCYGEDVNCWIDVEAPRYGWIWLNKTTKDTANKIREMFLSEVKYFDKNNAGRRIFIAENEKQIVIYLPMRNICQSDTILSLIKNNG